MYIHTYNACVRIDAECAQAAAEDADAMQRALLAVGRAIIIISSSSSSSNILFIHYIYIYIYI